MKRIFIASLLFLLATTTAAMAGTYHCDLKPKGTGDWISEVVIVQFNEGTGDVVVYDAVIKHFVGSPIKGTLKSANASRLLFGWSVPGAKDKVGHYSPGITYSLNIIRSSGAATISGKPQGNYTNHWTGSGTCTLE